MSGWIAASYGELALVRGQVERARTHYRQAIALIAPEAPHHPLLALYRLRV